MEQAIKTAGHISDSRHIELDEPLPTAQGRVEIELRLTERPTAPKRSAREFINSLTPGTRTQDELDRELQAERDSWGDAI